MSTQFFGKRIKRNEDPRLLTGRALFVDDVHLPDMAHVAFVRSPYAHARILGIDAASAKEMDGVIKIITANDLGDYWQPGPLLVSPPPIENLIFNERTQVPLAKDKVRFVGEPVVMIVAETRYLAEDAAEIVWVDYEDLQAVADLESAINQDAPLIHEDLESNVAAHVVQEKGNYAAIRDQADILIQRRFVYDRGTAAAMENRGVVAHWDDRAAKLTIWDTTQAPIPIRNGLARMMHYQEEVLIPWAAIRLDRPLKWIEDRSENFVATNQERSQIHDAEIALSQDGRILGIHDVFLHDTGAYNPYGLTVPINSQCTLLGPYDVPNYYSEYRVVFTNKTIVTPYRGAGRQHGVFVMERFLDIAAQEIGLSPHEIRRRNYIPSDKFPYNNEIIFQDFQPLIYDSGNYEPALDQAMELIGYQEFQEKIQPEARDEGRHLGMGIVSYVEGTGIGPYEGARVQIESSGKATVVTGVGTQGQGHYTSFAQIVADQIGVDVKNIDVVTGDTDQFHWGSGTFASRGAVVAGNAINEAAKDVRIKILKLAGELLEAAEDDLEIIDGEVRVRGVPQRFISLAELAKEANPLRGAVKPGTEPGLEATNYFGPEMGATASGTHAMIVEVDIDTMDVKILNYVVVHDCGRIINPLIVDGQIHGGVAQGIGNAFFEQLVYDKNGQLLNGSFMDFLLPTSLDVPRIVVGHQETISPLNPLGIKGAGEAGAIPTAALFAQAVENALDIPGFEILEIPLNPSKLWELVQDHKAN
jgi:CO/xanthine dehydrogenase Mo-binding subunit